MSGLLIGQLGALLAAQRRGVVALVPLPEGGRIDDDDGVLDEGLGSHQLVVAGVVDDVNDPGLPGDALGSPGEVAGVQSEGTVLGVAAATSDGVDSLLAQLGHGSWTAQLELALVTDRGALATSGTTFVQMIS